MTTTTLNMTASDLSSTSSAGDYTMGERAAIVCSCMLGFALDLYDVLIMPFLMGSIEKSLRVSLTEVASVTSLTLIGSVIGGALFGWIGDRLGRRQALQLTLGVFAVGSIASAFSWSYASLAILRFVTGVGLGGEWGAGMVLFNEAWNKDRRGLGSAFIQGSAVLAGAGASIVGVWATTSFSLDWGWRIVGNSALGVVGTWLSELYPIEVRSTAVSFFYMAGRGVGSLAPVLVPMTAAYFGGELAMGMLVAAAAAIVFLAMTLMLPETHRRGSNGHAAIDPVTEQMQTR
jgi:MFS family permease